MRKDGYRSFPGLNLDRRWFEGKKKQQSLEEMKLRILGIEPEDHFVIQESAGYYRNMTAINHEMRN